MQLLSVVPLAGGSIIDLDATFFVQMVIFFIALAVLTPLVFRPVMRLFDAREMAIDGARAGAREMEREAEVKAKTFEDEMRRVRLDAGKERDHLRADGQRLERQILDKVRVEMQSTIGTAEERLAKEARKVRREIDATIPALARDIASRLLGREVK